MKTTWVVLWVALSVFGGSKVVWAQDYRIMSYIQNPEDLANQPKKISRGSKSGKIGHVPLRVSKKCRARSFASTVHENLDGLESHLEFCQGEVYDGTGNKYIDMLSEYTLREKYELHTQVQGYTFFDSFGRKVDTHLALKPGSKKRPLVIFKCGLNCDIGNGTTKVFFRQLFDSTPFHLLIVTNMSGKQFLHNNTFIGTSGFDEGRNFIEIARYVQSEAFPHHDKFSSIHMSGISLGGHSTLYAALYHDGAVASGQEPFVNSFFAGCPVVNVQDSFRGLLNSALTQIFFSDKFIATIKQGAENLPSLRPYLEKIENAENNHELQTILSEAGAAITDTMMEEEPWGTPPFAHVRLQTANDFDFYNNFAAFAWQIKSNVLVWAPKDDPVVLYPYNGELLKGDSPSISVVGTSYGAHCSYGYTFSPLVSQTIWKNYVLKNSPEFERNFEEISLGTSLTQNLGQKRNQLYWTVESGASHAKLVSKKIKHQRHHRKKAKTYITRSISVPLSRLGLDSPKNKVEAGGVARWLHHNVEILDENREAISSKGWIETLRFPEY